MAHWEDGDVHQQAAEAARSQVRTGILTVKTGGGGHSRSTLYCSEKSAGTKKKLCDELKSEEVVKQWTGNKKIL